jgi:hypothetical protein
VGTPLEPQKFSERLIDESVVEGVIAVTINKVDIPLLCHGIADGHGAAMRSKLAEMMGD